SGGAAAERRRSIAVVVYDQSGIPDDCIARAKDDVVRLYGEAGVTVIWVGHAAVDTLTTFSIRLLIRPRPVGAHEGVMGTAIGGMHDTGGSAFVFYQQVLKSAHERKQDVARVLAYAIAHEI